MILRKKEAFEFVVVLATVMVYMATPSSADDICVWCNPEMSKNFLVCIVEQCLISPYFNMIPPNSMEDMKNGLVAASSAMKRSNEKTKMYMMNGAMAGGMADLIKSSCNESLCQNAEEVTANLMGIVGTCYTEVTGSTQTYFLGELRTTVEFILEENLTNSNTNVPGQANSQNQAQSIPNTASSAQASSNAGETQANAYSLAYSGQDFGYQPQTLTQNAVASSNQRGNNPLLNRQPYKYQQPASQSYLAQSTSQAIANTNTAGLTYPNGPSSFGQASASSYSGALANQQNVPSHGSNQPNNNYGSRNWNINQNTPNTGPQQNYGSWNTPPVNYPFSGQNTQQNGLSQNNAGSNLPNQGFGQNYGTAASQTGLQNSAYTPQNQIKSYSGATPQNTLYNLNNQPSYSQSQFNQSSSSENSAVLYNQPQAQNNYASANSFSSSQASSNAGETQANAYSSVSATSNNQQKNLPKKDRKPKPIQQKPLINKLSSKTKQQSSSNGNDEQTARALRFAETLYSALTQAIPFNQIFNNIDSDNAVPITYYIIQGSMNDCGYSGIAGIAANEAVVSLTSVPEKSSGDIYAEAFTKVLMTQLNNRNWIGNNPEKQATDLGNAIVTQLVKLLSSQSTTSTDSPVNTQASSGPTSTVSNAPDDDQQSHTKIKFSEALFYDLIVNENFQKIFNQKTSKASAKSFASNMLRSLSPDYGNAGTAAAANDCSKRLSKFPTKSNTDDYADCITQSVTDVFSKYYLISADTPSAQAKDIAAKIILYLKNELDKRRQATTISPAPINTSNTKNIPVSPGVQSISTVPSTVSSATQPSTSSFPNNKFQQQNGDNGQNQQMNYDYYSYYYDDQNSPTPQKNQKINQQNKITSQTVLASKPNQQNKKNPQQQTIPVSTVDGKDYIYYYYYDDDDQANQQEYTQPQKITYPPSGSQQDSGIPNNSNSNSGQQNIPVGNANYSPETSNQQNPGTQKNVKPNSGQKSNPLVEALNKLKLNKSANSKPSSGSEKAVSNSNSNVQNNGAKTSQGNNYNLPASYVQNNSSSNIVQPLSNPTPQSAPDQTSLQIPSQTLSNGKNAESKERIKILMQYAKSSISGDKFDYKTYSSVIAALAKFVQTSHPDWSADKCKTTVLIETILALAQLLTKSQNCPQDGTGNPSVGKIPQTTVGQKNVVQSANFQTSPVNVNSPALDNSASQQIPALDQGNIPVQGITASQQQIPVQTQGNVQSGAQYFSVPQQLPALGQRNANSAIQENFVPQQIPVPDQVNIPVQSNPASQQQIPVQTQGNFQSDAQYFSVPQQLPALGQRNANSAIQQNFVPQQIPVSNQANVNPMIQDSSSSVSQQGPVFGQRNVNPLFQGNSALYQIPPINQGILNPVVQNNVAPQLIPSPEYVVQPAYPNNQQSLSGVGQNQFIPSNLANQQVPALWSSTLGQVNRIIPGQGAWNTNDQPIVTSPLDMLGGNAFPNTAPLDNQGNWGSFNQVGQMNGNPMPATNQVNGDSFLAGNQNGLNFMGSPNQGNQGVPMQGNQQNWGPSIFPAGNPGLILQN